MLPTFELNLQDKKKHTEWIKRYCLNESNFSTHTIWYTVWCKWQSFSLSKKKKGFIKLFRIEKKRVKLNRFTYRMHPFVLDQKIANKWWSRAKLKAIYCTFKRNENWCLIILNYWTINKVHVNVTLPTYYTVCKRDCLIEFVSLCYH